MKRTEINKSFKELGFTLMRSYENGKVKKIFTKEVTTHKGHFLTKVTFGENIRIKSQSKYGNRIEFYTYAEFFKFKSVNDFIKTFWWAVRKANN